MTDLIFKPDNTPGYEIVYADESDTWVAVVHHPKGSRRWHAHYRTGPKDTFTTRKAMVRALTDRFSDD